MKKIVAEITDILGQKHAVDLTTQVHIENFEELKNNVSKLEKQLPFFKWIKTFNGYMINMDNIISIHIKETES